jgi:DNA polymerase III delta subunit
LFNKYQSPYKENEKNKFDNWIAEIKEMKHSIYIISGENFWKKETLDRMSKSVGKRPDSINENLKIFTDKMRYKSLSRKKHFVVFENKNKKLKEEDLTTLKQYFSDPSDDGILVISLKDWEDKKYFMNNFKMIKRSSKIKFFEFDYTSDYFKELFIRDKLKDFDFSFESEKVKNDLIRNLLLNMDELEDNFMTLESLESPIITKEEIKFSIEEYSDNNLTKMYDSLTKVNRKKVPFEVLNELLSDGRTPITILKGIRTHFIYLYQAKYLKLRGILRSNDIEEEKIKLYKDEKLIFKTPDIWQLTKRRRNNFLDDCEELSLKEIIQVLNLIDISFNKIRQRKGEKYTYIEYVGKEELFVCMIQIMNRRLDY